MSVLIVISQLLFIEAINCKSYREETCTEYGVCRYLNYVKFSHINVINLKKQHYF